jgi:hypothetical protein
MQLSYNESCQFLHMHVPFFHCVLITKVKQICQNTIVVKDAVYLFTDLLHISAHVRPSSGTLEEKLRLVHCYTLLCILYLYCLYTGI